MTLNFCIQGPPRSKKTSNRIFRAGGKGRIRVVPSAAHDAWFCRAMFQARLRWAQYAIDTIEKPVNVSAHVYRDALRGDLINILQAVADLLERAKIIANDRQIVSWDGSRLLLDRVNPRIEITIQSLNQEQA